MSYVYFLTLRDGTAFKIGKSLRPLNIISELSNYYDFTLKKSFLVDTDDPYLMVSGFHSLFKEKRVLQKHVGGTEFFNMSVFQKTKDILDLMGFKREPIELDKLVNEDVDEVDEVMNDIATSVKNKRLMFNITQVDLAQMCAVSLKVIQNIEAGNNVNLRNAIKIFQVLGMDDALTDLYTEIPMRKRVRQ